MFTRRALYHPYKSPAPPSPAGLRIADRVTPKRCFNLFQGPNFTNARSPAPSPVSSPIKGTRQPQDDLPPTTRLADLFGGNGLESPQRPSTPTPDHPRNATPNGQKTNMMPDQHPSPLPPRRKNKYGPKHLSFNNKNGAHAPDLVPPRRRAQQLKEKRETARRRILDHHERRVVRAREGISRLRKEAEALMTPEHMDEEDKIFLKQLRQLQLDQSLKHDLEQCRQRMSRAADESTKRRQEHEERDEEAAKKWGEGRDEEVREEQKRKAEARAKEEERKEVRHRRMEEAAMRADEERQRAYEALERTIREAQERLFHEELARKAKEEERRRREEQEHRVREERERQLREERERQLREERERRRQEERERMLREEVERVRKEAHEQVLREQRERMLREEVERLRREAHEQKERLAREEQERQARLLAEQARRAAQEDQARQRLVLYEGKWNELRTSNSLPPIDVREMPWPVFGVVSSADEITYHDVRTFLLHPQRPGVEGKTARDKVKSEVLRFHPDKFNARILPKIEPSQRGVAQEIAGAVARILTRIMTEEVGEQK